MIIVISERIRSQLFMHDLPTLQIVDIHNKRIISGYKDGLTEDFIISMKNEVTTCNIEMEKKNLIQI